MKLELGVHFIKMSELAQHPFGEQVDTIFTALLAGMADEPVDKPDSVILNFEDPLADGAQGVATLRFADWTKENQSVLYVPLAVNPEDMTWKVQCEDGLISVAARLMVRDMLGRSMGFVANGKKYNAAYMQFDVVPEGIVFSALVPNEGPVATYGAYEGATYDMLTTYANIHSGLPDILTMARKY